MRDRGFVLLITTHLVARVTAVPSGRWPRHPGGSPLVNNKPSYLSREGLAKLRDELEELKNVRRPEVAARIPDAKEHGDISENAEYEDAKNEQAFVEGRIQSLEALIKNAVIIDENHSTDSRPDRLDGRRSSRPTARRLPRSSARPRPRRRRARSPTSRRSGRALLGRKKGDKVTVSVPGGRQILRTPDRAPMPA